MPVKLALTNENYKWIADELGCEPEMVIAVSKVECKREPFDEDGFPAILFEKHVFYRNLEPHSLAIQYTRDYPSICGRTGYGKGRYGTYDEQRVRFSKAFALNKQAAMEGCSWGPFQELGENWEELGFKDVGEFVDTMKNGLFGACIIFIKSIKMRGLINAFKTRKYALIARKYNGSGYAKFNYDGQIEDQYLIAKKKDIDWSKIRARPAATKAKPRWIGDFAIKEVDLTPEALPVEVSNEVGVNPNDEVKNEGEHNQDDQTSNTKISITPQGEVKAEVNKTGDNSEAKKEIVAVEKAESVGFLESMWKKILGIFTGESGFSAITDKAQQAGALGLSPTFWERLTYLALAAGAIYLASQFYKHWQKKKHDNDVTKTLVNANTTPENIVQLVESWQIPILESQGVKIVRRGGQNMTQTVTPPKEEVKGDQ